MNRRNFLFDLGALSIFLSPFISKKYRNTFRTREDIPIVFKNFDYDKTTFQTLIMTFSQLIFQKFCEEYELNSKPTNQEPILRALKQNKLKTMINTTVSMPLLEEFGFRLWFNTFLPNNNKNYWELGIPVNIFFAYYHNFEKNEEDNIEFESEYIPIPQFIMGCFYWYLIRQKGFEHSVLSHLENNVIALTLLMLKEK